ncbi:hypothetical protein BGZ99_002558 [Dissophora globulifera]|uniref:SLC26A/SulP transporter domain-containing protein n=1 Tax=Dissophora globulifera TaxID=979702 RepID=A0A9P6UXH1_9FUNG|nr:hypothetical protein BGZ99_002558 [Dissophora globulifera]
MASGPSSPAPPGNTGNASNRSPDRHVGPSSDQPVHPFHHFSSSPPSLDPASAPSAPSPMDISATSSRAASICSGSSASTISNSDESISSLGGLNHVNDGVGGSTTQRRMSRAFSPDDFRSSSPLATSPRSVSHPSFSQHEQQQYPQPGRPGLARGRSLSSTSFVTSNDDVSVAERESTCKTWLRRKVPIFGWLISPGYKWADLPDDLIAGITISTVVIPQSMAYAMLAPLPPVYGLYTSVVPILLYCIFGTSRHMHTGTFAITTLLLGQAVRSLMAQSDETASHPSADFGLASTFLYGPNPLSSAPSDDPEYERRFIGMILMLSFVVGVVQVVLSFLRVGGWASKHLLPDALVGGFNTAAVFHIGTSQLEHFLGIVKVPSSKGAFGLLKSWVWFGTHLSEINRHTVFLGSAAIVFMTLMRKLERRRREMHELEMRKNEMFLIQQRQAVSAAIVRNHEERREQQRRWMQQQQQKGNDNVNMNPNPGASNNAITGDFGSTSRATNMSPYTSRPSSRAMASDISLRTVLDDNENRTVHGNSRPSIAFAPTIARTLSDAEQALSSSLTVTPTVIQDRKVYVPIPDILMAVILLTVLNVVFSLDTPRSEGGWGIIVIGSIPRGMPEIVFPANLITSGPKEWMTLEFLKTTILPMIQPALLIAVIIYVMSFSIAKQFGKRYGYKVDANQEMLALGLASMGGSIFSGYACTGSLTRTAILSQSGGKTPLASMVGVATVILALTMLTWCFERVPNTVLAAIVLVALQSLVMQITEPARLWRLGQRKASMIWVVTFTGVLFVSVELGIAIGIAVVLLSTGYGWAMRRHRGGDEPLLNPRRRMSRRLSQGDSQAYGRYDDATGSLLNNTAADVGTVGQRRRGNSDSMRLSAGSPVSQGADWKRRMMRTKWGQKIGSLLGMERPIFSDSLHANTEDDDY